MSSPLTCLAGRRGAVGPAKVLIEQLEISWPVSAAVQVPGRRWCVKATLSLNHMSHSTRAWHGRPQSSARLCHSAAPAPRAALCNNLCSLLDHEPRAPSVAVRRVRQWLAHRISGRVGGMIAAAAYEPWARPSFRLTPPRPHSHCKNLSKRERCAAE